MERSYEELAVNKLYILYILQRIELPLTNAQITHILLENDLLDYFSLQQYFHELTESGLIASSFKEGLPYFVIADKGKTALSYFQSRIPSSITQNLDHYLSDKKDLLRKEQEISVSMEQNPTGDYQVHLQISDNENPYIRIDLKVPTARTARRICDNWKASSSDIYSNVIEALIQPGKEK